MAIFISAGHNTEGPKKDPGAVANGYTEAALAVEFRDLLIQEVNALGYKVIKDENYERLGEYLARIQTGSGSVVLEIHFDAAASETATGTTTLYPGDSDRLDIAFSKEIVETTSKVLGIKNRGALSETQSHRGRLGLMRENGTVSLLEVCFITNKKDLNLYMAKKEALAKELAKIVVRYENLV
jgi:N-acetylmuramoyl-L-alanine amidase